MSVRQRMLLAGIPLAVATLAIIISSAYMGRGPSVAVVEALTPTPSWTPTNTPLAYDYYAELDCHPATPGTQTYCTYPWNAPADIAIDIIIGNNSAIPRNFNYFEFELISPNGFSPISGSDANLNAAPDFNEAAFGAGWTCTPPPPEIDRDPSPSQSVSFLSCYASPFPEVTLPAGGTLKLATLHYYSFPQSMFGTFALANVAIISGSGGEIFTCNPIQGVGGNCRSADIQTVHVFPTATWTNTPTPTSTPTATPTTIVDSDSDGVPNSNDNCPDIANPDQENSDANLISNAPIVAQNDLTRAHSDGLGDVCDPDMDNDGIANHTEECCMVFYPGMCAELGFFQTSPLDPDTDGDRFRDGVECFLGSHPYMSSSRPPVTTCGLTTDADNDGLNNRIEYCFYNTNPNVADTDGDGVKDGCEAASFNGDTIVNVADLGMLATEISRPVPASQKLVNLDVNKDGAYNPADLGMVAARVGKCP